MIEWNCPSCLTQYTYNGVQEKKATSKCSNSECAKYRKTVKVWYHKCTPDIHQKKNKMLEISLERLKPPRAPKMVETSVADVAERVISVGSTPNYVGSTQSDSKTIDFSYLTNNSSFQRAIMEFIRRFVPGLEDIKVRGNKEVMKQSFNQNANNYRNVMKELKQVLEARKK